MSGRGLKIVSYNVNGIKARLERLVEYLTEQQPDVVCLQELKSADDGFPEQAIRDAGYGAVWHGQKGWNGVAVLAKGVDPVERQRGLAGDPDDEHSRYLECEVDGLVVASLYLPNGNPIDDPVKFPYKLSWMARLEAWAAERLALEEALVLAGDYNVIPEPIDAKFPENWVGDALFQPQTRQAFRRLKHLGFTEAIRAVTDAPGTFTFWDYQGGAWQKNNGIRIDHLLLSPEAANRFSSASIEKHVRAWEKPSDHVPVAVELDLAAA